jgi:hypothetical protein
MPLFSDSERLLTPPGWTSVDENVPVVFIAGPIQGAPDFQTPFAHRMIAAHPHLVVASPRRLEIDKNFNYDKQVKWEQANLGRAAFNGIQAFWLEPRDHSLPYEEGRPYGKTTFGEFNQFYMRKMLRPETRGMLGIHPDYTASGGISERYTRLLAEIAGLTVIHSRIEDLEAAVLEELA